MYGVEPDMAMFGKALGNGYAITAVIGRREIMEAAQTTFISSTFWTERIGPAAALKTLEVMERVRSWEQITATGRDITQPLAGAGGEARPADQRRTACRRSPASRSTAPNALAYKTLITQEMLAKGYPRRHRRLRLHRAHAGDRRPLLRGARSGVRPDPRMRRRAGRDVPAQGAGVSRRLQATELMRAFLY